MHTVHDIGENVHVPVLLKEVVDLLNPKLGESYLDLTAGYGGHSGAVLGYTKTHTGSVLVDRDIEAVKHNQSLFGDQGVEIMQSAF